MWFSYFKYCIYYINKIKINYNKATTVDCLNECVVFSLFKTAAV